MGKISFRQADLKRATKGAMQAGLEISRVEIEPSGKIVLVAKSEREAPAGNDLDKWLNKHAH
jgi:hypothetical protein